MSLRCLAYLRSRSAAVRCLKTPPDRQGRAQRGIGGEGGIRSRDPRSHQRLRPDPKPSIHQIHSKPEYQVQNRYSAIATPSSLNAAPPRTLRCCGFASTNHGEVLHFSPSWAAMLTVLGTAPSHIAAAQHQPNVRANRLHSGVEELDLELSVDDWLRLPDQLIQPLLDGRSRCRFSSTSSFRV